MLKPFVFFGLVIWLAQFFPVRAENVRIYGSVPEGAGLTIEVVTYDDYISKTLKKLAGTEIKGNGSFEIDLQINTTIFCYLRIGIQASELLIEPGKEYRLKITGLLGEEMRKQEIAHFQLPALELEILNPWQHELNLLTKEFLDFHDNYIAQHAVPLLMQRSNATFREFVTLTYQLFPGVDNAWFNDLLTYKIARLEMSTRIGTKEQLASKYLREREVLYTHMAYMDFFNDFFEKYLSSSRLFSRQELSSAANSSQPLKNLMDLLAKDALLDDKQIRELVILRNIIDLRNTLGLSQESIMGLLNEVRLNSIYPEHRTIAANLINLFS